MLPTEDSNHDPNDQIRQQLDREFTCEHQEMSLVVKQQRNGLRYFRQCQRCGNTWSSYPNWPTKYDSLVEFMLGLKYRSKSDVMSSCGRREGVARPEATA